MAVRRSKDEIVNALKAKVQYHEKCIVKLNAQIESALAPKNRARKTSMKKAIDTIRESGLTPDEIISAVDKATKARQKTEAKSE